VSVCRLPRPSSSSCRLGSSFGSGGSNRQLLVSILFTYVPLRMECSLALCMCSDNPYLLSASDWLDCFRWLGKRGRIRPPLHSAGSAGRSERLLSRPRISALKVRKPQRPGGRSRKVSKRLLRFRGRKSRSPQNQCTNFDGHGVPGKDHESATG